MMLSVYEIRVRGNTGFLQRFLIFIDVLVCVCVCECARVSECGCESVFLSVGVRERVGVRALVCVRVCVCVCVCVSVCVLECIRIVALLCEFKIINTIVKINPCMRLRLLGAQAHYKVRYYKLCIELAIL